MRPLDPFSPASQRRWRLVGAAASFALFALSLAVLALIVRELDAADVRAAFAAASARQVTLAMLCVTGSYLLLTSYDAIGLRQLGRQVAYPITALGSFTSYAVSFTLGFPLITGGTVRYWIYSTVGIGAKTVASLTLIAGVTFWLGMGAVLGAGLLWRPAGIGEFNRLPASLNALLGLGVLGLIGLYLVWVSRRPRVFRVQGWTLALPNLPVSLLQLTIGALDVCAAGGALYLLLPQGYAVPYGAFIAAYAFACLLGVASHAPGGIGVFEATILLALPGVPKEQLLGSLLLFRLLYYIIPFVLALVLLAGREITLRWRLLKRDAARAEAADELPGGGA
jgi:hypothetical protein